MSEHDLVGAMDGRRVVAARELLRSGKVAYAKQESPGWVFGSVRHGNNDDEQVINAGLRGDELLIEGGCTCGAGRNCVHVVAVLLHLSHIKPIELHQVDPTDDIPPSDPFVERWLRRVANASLPPDAYPPDVQQRVLYILEIADQARTATVRAVTAKLLRDGSLSKPIPTKRHTIISHQFAKYHRPIDIRLLQSMVRSLPPTGGDEQEFKLNGPESGSIVAELISTGR